MNPDELKETLIIHPSSSLSFSELSGEFLFFSSPQKTKKIQLLLDLSFLTIQLNEKTKTININDLIGASYIFVEKFTLFQLSIHISKLHSASCLKKEYRSFETLNFYDPELEKIKKWCEILLKLSKKLEITQNPYILKKILIFVNPIGGKGHSLNIYRKNKSIIEQCGHQIELIETQYYKHAYEFLMNKTHEEILEYNIISSISGDGLPHEIVNALFNRKDSESLKDIPLAFIPGGSGNALAMNVLHISKENSLSIESIIYLICKGQKKKMDIIKFTTLEGENIYSLLSFSWGIWSDVDLESEILRWLGEARFTAYAIIRLLKLRKYYAKLSFCLDVNEEKMPGIEEDISEKENWTHIDGKFLNFMVSNLPFLSSSMKVSPMSVYNDGFMDLQFFSRESATKMNLIKYFLKVDEKGSMFNFREDKFYSNCNEEFFKVKGFRLEPYGNRLGKYSIDGEKYEAKRIQGVILPNHLSFISL